MFGKRGLKRRKNENGAWEVDHVLQRGKGGKNAIENYLPACVRCNRLRWHRKGKDLRELLLLGVIAKDEIKKDSALGQKLNELVAQRISTNKLRRSRRGSL